jgi:hypothetical protein
LIKVRPVSDEEDIGEKIFGNKKNPKTDLKKGENYVHRKAAG